MSFWLMVTLFYTFMLQPEWEALYSHFPEHQGLRSLHCLGDDCGAEGITGQKLGMSAG